MTTTTRTYVGIDLTDRYANKPRATDVCTLRVLNGTLSANWQAWEWPEPKADMSSLVRDFGDSRTLFIDGPQGLALVGSSMRQSERELGAQAKTGDRRPDLSRLFAGFVTSSLDVFEGLRLLGCEIGAASMLGAQEVYPAAIWSRLASGLAKKSSALGRAQRATILDVLAVSGVPKKPTHDQLDACISAVLGAAVDGLVPGVAVAPVGLPVVWDEERQALREGVILVPVVDAGLRERIRAEIAALPLESFKDLDAIRELASTPFADCPFCGVSSDRVRASSRFGVAIRDAHPVSLGHALVIPKRHVGSFFELSSKERADLMSLLDVAKAAIDREFSPAGYNIGVNDGASAGQTISHVHIHLIPRYAGDQPDPRGGVRWIFPDKADYWSPK